MKTLPEQPPQSGPWCGESGYQYRTLPSSPKYTVTEVMASRRHVVIKRATNGAGNHDLGNAVAWAHSISSRHPQTFAVPVADSYPVKDVEGRYHVGSAAVFKWVSGTKPEEANLRQLVEPIADVVSELSGMHVDWEGNAKDWLRQRREGKVAQALTHLADRKLAAALDELLSDESIEVVQPGITHGDLKPDNILMRPGKSLVLLDGEFGTHDRRPEYTVPRATDAGHFFHILQTQYRQPDTADTFRKEGLIQNSGCFQYATAWYSQALPVG